MDSLTETTTRSIQGRTNRTRILAQGIPILQTTNRIIRTLQRLCLPGIHWTSVRKESKAKTYPFPARLTLGHLDLGPCSGDEEQSEECDL